MLMKISGRELFLSEFAVNEQKRSRTVRIKIIEKLSGVLAVKSSGQALYVLCEEGINKSSMRKKCYRALKAAKLSTCTIHILTNRTKPKDFDKISPLYSPVTELATE